MREIFGRIDMFQICENSSHSCLDVVYNELGSTLGSKDKLTSMKVKEAPAAPLAEGFNAFVISDARLMTSLSATR